MVVVDRRFGISHNWVPFCSFVSYDVGENIYVENLCILGSY